MPFYEYECSACKHHTEVLQKISDAPLKKCPNCGKQTLQRLISAPVFRLKGGGWYETDFKSDNETKRNLVGKEEGESKPEEKKTEASTDSSKSEAKTEAKKPEVTPSVKSGSGAKAKPAKVAKPKSKAKVAAGVRKR
jgi:putative FmdB family regulatory protein